MRFCVYDRMAERGQALFVTGGIPQLGNWQPDLMLPMTGESSMHGACWQEVPCPGVHARTGRETL